MTRPPGPPVVHPRVRPDCSVLHRTADLEREIYGDVVPASVAGHLDRCAGMLGGFAIPRPPKGPGGGSPVPPFRPDLDLLIRERR